jgi:hypothetical protein
MPTRTLPLALGALAALAACGSEPVTHFRVPKPAPAAAMAAAAPAPAPGAEASDAPAPAPGASPGMQGDVPPPPAPRGAAALAWTLPAGWSQTLQGGMRYASFRTPYAGKADASVVVLPGDAGGELANVNRWRGQIALDPIDAAALAAARKVVRTPAGPVAVYDFASEAKGARLIAGLVELEGNTWFLKITGDAKPVGEAAADFNRLLGSLRLGDASR